MKLSLLLKRIARRLLKSQLKKKNLFMRDSAASRNALLDLMDALGPVRNITMVEIGSYKGESAEIFLKSGKVAKLYCIDPWQMFYDDDDGAAFTDMEKVEAVFDERFANDARVVKAKGTVDDFVRNHATDMPHIDLVYIDGCHTYEAVKHDITESLSHLKPAIAIAGHDYNGCWDGTMRAVEETIGRPDSVFSDTSWLKKLPLDR